MGRCLSDERIAELQTVCRELYPLGISQQMIAEALDIHSATLVRLTTGIPYQARPVLKYREALRLYLELSTSSRSGATNSYDTTKKRILARALELDEIKTYAEAYEALFAKLIKYQPADDLSDDDRRYLSFIQQFFADMRGHIPGIYTTALGNLYARRFEDGGLPDSKSEALAQITQTANDAIRYEIAPEITHDYVYLVRKALDYVQASTTDRSWEVFVARYGLDGSPLRTPKECAQLFGLGHERVRQLLERAERYLRQYFYHIDNRLNCYTKQRVGYARWLSDRVTESRFAQPPDQSAETAAPSVELGIRIGDTVFPWSSLTAPIEEVFSVKTDVRIINSLRRGMIHTALDLITEPQTKIEQFCNIGAKSMETILARMNARGLVFCPLSDVVSALRDGWVDINTGNPIMVPPGLRLDRLFDPLVAAISDLRQSHDSRWFADLQIMSFIDDCAYGRRSSTLQNPEYIVRVYHHLGLQPRDEISVPLARFPYLAFYIQ